jgi:hypothetical protein
MYVEAGISITGERMNPFDALAPSAQPVPTGGNSRTPAGRCPTSAALPGRLRRA